MATLQFALSDSAEAGPDTWQFTVFLSFVSLCWFLCWFFFLLLLCWFFLSFFFIPFLSFCLSLFVFLILSVFFFLYSSCLLIPYLVVCFLLLCPFNPCITHTLNKPQRLPKTGHTKQFLSGRNCSIFCIPMLFAWPHSTLHCQTQQKQAQIYLAVYCFSIFCIPMLVSMLFLLFSSSLLVLSFFILHSLSFCLSLFVFFILSVFFFLYFSCLLILYLVVSFLLLCPFSPCITHTLNKPQRLPKTGHTKQFLSGRHVSIFCIPMLSAWPHSTLHCQTQQKQAQIYLAVYCFSIFCIPMLVSMLFLLFSSSLLVLSFFHLHSFSFFLSFFICGSYYFCVLLSLFFLPSYSLSSCLLSFALSFQPMHNSYPQQTSAPA